MPQEFEDYYKRLRDNDYKVDPFNMKMLNKDDKANKKLPIILPNGPIKYKPKIKSLKNTTDIELDEWKKNYKLYNSYVTNDDYKKQQTITTNNINENRNSVKYLKSKINKDVQINDDVLFKHIKHLENLKKKLTERKIKYNKLLHSANAAVQLKKDKDHLYTETTVRLILQVVGICIAGGIVYKIGS